MRTYIADQSFLSNFYSVNKIELVQELIGDFLITDLVHNEFEQRKNTSGYIPTKDELEYDLILPSEESPLHYHFWEGAFYSSPLILSVDLERSSTGNHMYLIKTSAEIGDRIYLSPDDSVILCARKYSSIVLSSDKQIRYICNKQKIECHGSIWLLKKAIHEKKLTKVAAQKIHDGMIEAGNHIPKYDF